MMVSFKKVSWVLDADLKGFFDNIVHACLLRQIWYRICDERVVTMGVSINIGVRTRLNQTALSGHTEAATKIQIHPL
jgi:retron-type reverse transcriptase